MPRMANVKHFVQAGPSTAITPLRRWYPRQSKSNASTTRINLPPRGISLTHESIAQSPRNLTCKTPDRQNNFKDLPYSPEPQSNHKHRLEVRTPPARQPPPPPPPPICRNSTQASNWPPNHNRPRYAQYEALSLGHSPPCRAVRRPAQVFSTSRALRAQCPPRGILHELPC